MLEAAGGVPDQLPLGAQLLPSCPDDPDTSLHQHTLDGLRRLRHFMLSIGLPYDYGWEARAARYRDGSDSGSGSDSGDDSDVDAGQGAAELRPPKATFVQLLFRHKALTRGHAVYGMEPAIRRACLRN
jgi:hypothetical protein